MVPQLQAESLIERYSILSPDLGKQCYGHAVEELEYVQ